MTGACGPYNLEGSAIVILDGLPDLYGLKCDGLTTLVVAIVLVLL